MSHLDNFPEAVQDFLITWVDDLVKENANKNLDESELIDTLAASLEPLANSLQIVYDVLRGLHENPGAPFHCTMGSEGLLFRSNEDVSIIEDEGLFDLKWVLSRQPFLKSDLQNALQKKTGSINFCSDTFDRAQQEFLNDVSDRINLTCVFKKAGQEHEVSAGMIIDDKSLLCICSDDETHNVRVIE